MNGNPFALLWEYYDKKVSDDETTHKDTPFYQSPYKSLLHAQGYFVESRLNINISDILTKLIQDTGRFCESYASDLLISLQSLNTIIENPNSCMEPYYEFFGIRKQGVDGISYVANNLLNHIETPWELEQYYRKLYGIRVIHTDERNQPYSCYLHVELRDFTTDIGILGKYFKETKFNVNDYYHTTEEQNKKELLTKLFQLQQLQKEFQKQKMAINEQIYDSKITDETLTHLCSITSKDTSDVQNAINTVYHMLQSNPKGTDYHHA